MPKKTVQYFIEWLEKNYEKDMKKIWFVVLKILQVTRNLIKMTYLVLLLYICNICPLNAPINTATIVTLAATLTNNSHTI